MDDSQENGIPSNLQEHLQNVFRSLLGQENADVPISVTFVSSLSGADDANSPNEEDEDQDSSNNRHNGSLLSTLSGVLPITPVPVATNHSARHADNGRACPANCACSTGSSEKLMKLLKQIYSSMTLVEAHACTKSQSVRFSANPIVELVAERLKDADSMQSMFLREMDECIVLPGNIRSASLAYVNMTNYTFLRQAKDNLNGSFRLIQTIAENLSTLRTNSVAVVDALASVTNSTFDSAYELLNTWLTSIRNTFNLLAIRIQMVDTIDYMPGAIDIAQMMQVFRFETMNRLVALVQSMPMWRDHAFFDSDEKRRLMIRYMTKLVATTMSKLASFFTTFREAHLYGCALAMQKAKWHKESIDLNSCMGSREFVGRITESE